ncbi:MAG: mechanosensitive ion channel [Gammaproteobacteria bacterium]
MRSETLTPSIGVLISKLVRISLIIGGFLLAISSVGINLTVFTVFGGALGVGLGFGLQKVVSNFISGIILLLDKSIKPGDVISIGDTYGWVNSLNARYVSLDTIDGKEHLIPNEELIIQRVENWSYSNKRLRLRVPVGVHYKSDVRKAMQLCVDAANESVRVLEHPKPVCMLRGFGDSSVDLEIAFWINDPEKGLNNVESDVLLRIWDKFHENDVEIPYPQRDVYLKTPIDIKRPPETD